MTSVGELRRSALAGLSKPSYSLARPDMVLLNDNANLFGNNPAVQVIADEPTANLDTARSRDFMRIVGELKAAGKTVLLSSHDPEVYDAPQVDRVIEMRDGRVAGG